MRIHDISPRIHEGIAVWPGDTPFRREAALSIADGHNIDLSAISTTVHLGAHADSQSHYHGDGVGIDEHPLEAYLGPCQVIRVAVPRGARVLPEHLDVEVTAPRVLVATGSFPNPDAFNEDFNSLSPELVEFLAARNVVLVGIDTPSVDPFTSKALETHQALYRHRMANLEGLVLNSVPEGSYFLSALPLKIQGADASPVRAVLVEGMA